MKKSIFERIWPGFIYFFILHASSGNSMELNNTLSRAIIEGRMDFFRSYSLNGTRNGSSGSVYYASCLNYAPLNGILEENERYISEEEVDSAIAFFTERQLPFIWWGSSKTLESKGLQFGGILKGIALDMSHGIATNEVPTGVEIKIVRSDPELRDFADLAVLGFGMALSDTEGFRAINAATMEREEQIHFIAYQKDQPIGIATLSTGDFSAGIWNLTTLPQCRNLGVGSALVRAALEEAKRLGYDQVMAILMPKGMAWGLFTKLGFKECCQFPFYLYGLSSEELEKS